MDVVDAGVAGAVARGVGASTPRLAPRPGLAPLRAGSLNPVSSGLLPWSAGLAPAAALADGFFNRPARDVARALLGSRLTSTIGGRRTCGVVVETEAYEGPSDPASHAATVPGVTKRNAVMFGPAGFSYVYRIYGVHWCMNVVTGEIDLPHAVLLRGGVPVRGISTLVKRRGRSDHLVDGPGKLCQALGVTGDCDGTSVVDGPVRLMGGSGGGEITASPRIGLSKAKDRPWRYVLSDVYGARVPAID